MDWVKQSKSLKTNVQPIQFLKTRALLLWPLWPLFSFFIMGLVQLFVFILIIFLKIPLRKKTI